METGFTASSLTELAQSDVGYSLDLLCRRYGGVTPSQLLRFHPLDGRGLLFDLEVARNSAIRDMEDDNPDFTRYRMDKARWDREAYEGLARLGRSG